MFYVDPTFWATFSSLNHATLAGDPPPRCKDGNGPRDRGQLMLLSGQPQFHLGGLKAWNGHGAYVVWEGRLGGQSWGRGGEAGLE